MRNIFTIYGLVAALLLGVFAGNVYHAEDYRTGFNAGYAAGWKAAEAPRPEKQVITNLLCHYAELSCHSQSHQK